MIIFPAIDIKNNRCVRLKQGRFDEVTVYHEDPATVAKQWEDAGASIIHVVDLDGARSGTAHNLKTVERIVKTVAIPIQLGGGIRNSEDLERVFNVGVRRAIIGTAALKDPLFLQNAVERYHERIVLGLDALRGLVAVEGWEEVSTQDAFDFCREIKKMGITEVIYTDILKDGMMSGPNIETTGELIKKTRMKVIASGGVSSLHDLENLKKIGATGAIIGKSLYNGTLDLKQVIEKFERGEY